MDFRMKITLTLPEEMIKTMGITEDTLFITSYDNGRIYVEPYDEEDLAEDFPDAHDDEEFDDEIEALLDDAYERGFKKGSLQGYADGYACGFGDAHKMHPYNYYYRGRVNEFHDHPADMPCRESCKCKNKN